jgi:hypothetical protein
MRLSGYFFWVDTVMGDGRWAAAMLSVKSASPLATIPSCDSIQLFMPFR